MDWRETNTVCLCNFCGMWLVFDEERAGNVINCPHCLMETILSAPGSARPDAPNLGSFRFRRIEWGQSAAASRSIVGVMLHRWRSRLSWVRLQFNLYDGADALIGTASDCILDLAANSVWNFQAPVCADLVIRASLPTISTEHGKIVLDDGFGEIFGGYRRAVTPASTDRPVSLSSYANTFRGKARASAAQPQKVVPVHWSISPVKSINPLEEL